MLTNDALLIEKAAISASLPYNNTKKLLSELTFSQKSLTVIAVGKAAVPMAKAAHEVFGKRITNGLLVTKYRHTGDFFSPYFTVIEAGHPVSDQNSELAAKTAMELAKKADENTLVLFLISGGASALMERSLVDAELQQKITGLMLKRGADIEKMNAVRRSLSMVKGGKLGALCAPAGVITVCLSDVLSNNKQVIGGGLTIPGTADMAQLQKIAEEYLFDLPKKDLAPLFTETELPVVNSLGYYFAGDITSLCEGAAKKAEELGYTPHLITKALTGEAREVAEKLLNELPRFSGRHAFLYGGETTVTVKGSGLGGRNQELCLTAAIWLKDKKNLVFASIGSDGTDGPTDAAGGIVDEKAYQKMLHAGLNPLQELANNNAYAALNAAGALIKTGATGTNVNDLTLILTDFA